MAQAYWRPTATCPPITSATSRKIAFGSVSVVTRWPRNTDSGGSYEVNRILRAASLAPKGLFLHAYWTTSVDRTGRRDARGAGCAHAVGVGAIGGLAARTRCGSR